MTTALNRSNKTTDTQQIKPYATRKLKFDQLKDTVNTYLTSLDAPFVSSVSYQTLYDQCMENFANRGWSDSTQAAARVFLDPGLLIACTAYAHVSQPIQIFVAIYTSLLIYIDDISAKEDINLLKSFSKVLLEERSHGHEVLDAVAEILREIPNYYGDLTGSIIISATLRYITSVILEQEEVQSFKSTRKSNTRFPRYLRDISGVGEAYGIFVFPPSIPYSAYIQAIPDLCTKIAIGNDVLSFYKEELTSDEANLVSFLASSEKASKVEVHRQLMEEALQCDRSILELLDGHQEAFDAYMCFRTGYIAFHTCTSRYKLRELLDL